VQSKLDVVKTVMQDNIQQILINQEQVDRINSSAERLTEQSLAFKSTTNELRNKMFWKMVKMRLLIGGIIVCVLVVIIVPIVIMTKSTKK
jgi:glutamate 5-kinase